MLRPRRPRSTLSSTSMQDSCHSHTTWKWNCPDMALIDDSQSSSYSDSSDDEEYSISELKHPQHRQSCLESGEKEDSKPLCRVPPNRDKLNAKRALAVRTIMTLITVAAVALSYLSAATSDNSEVMIDPRISTDRAVNTNESSGSRIRKRRLVEIPIRKQTTKVVPKTTTTSKSIRQGGDNAVPVSIAQKAKLHRDSMQRLIHQYGIGPHLVEFQIRIWPENDSSGTSVGEPKPIISYFTIEMAPVHMMPLSVHQFLEQVANKLWDETSFFMNVPHLIAAHPVSANGRRTKPRHLFTTITPPSSLYSEFNSAYPHLQYTLGFVGNGPEFYINKVTNPHHSDPCFANIVIGRSIIDALFRTRGHDRTPERIRPVEIVTARIIQRDSLHPTAMEEYVRTTIPPHL